MQRLAPTVALSAGLSTVMGCAYVFGSPVRTDTPSFAAAKSLAPMHVWGWLFLFGAFILPVTWGMGSRSLVVMALIVSGLIYTWWGAMFGQQALTNPLASLSAWAVFLVIGAWHFIVAYRLGTRGTP